MEDPELPAKGWRRLIETEAASPDPNLVASALALASLHMRAQSSTMSNLINLNQSSPRLPASTEIHDNSRC